VIHARRLVCLGLIWLTGCRPAPTPVVAPPAPSSIHSYPGPAAVGLVAVQEGQSPARMLAIAQDGTTRWLSDRDDQPGPQLPAQPTRGITADVDADGAPDLIVGGRDRIAVYTLAGRLLWDYPTGGAPVLDLAAADLGAQGEVLVFAAGPPPLGLIAIAPDGKLSWRATGYRSAFSLAALPAVGENEGTLYCVGDDGQVTGLDVLGTVQSRWGLKIGPQHLVLAATGVSSIHGAEGPALLVVGRIFDNGQERATWALTRRDGSVAATGGLPALPEFDRARPVAAQFAGEGADVVAMPTRLGSLLWLAPASTSAPVGEPLDLPTLCLAVGPDVDGRPTLLAGTATGVEQFRYAGSAP